MKTFISAAVAQHTKISQSDSTTAPDKLETLCYVQIASMLHSVEDIDMLTVPDNIKEMIKCFFY